MNIRLPCKQSDLVTGTKCPVMPPSGSTLGWPQQMSENGHDLADIPVKDRFPFSLCNVKMYASVFQINHKCTYIHVILNLFQIAHITFKYQTNIYLLTINQTVNTAYSSQVICYLFLVNMSHLTSFSYLIRISKNAFHLEQNSITQPACFVNYAKLVHNFPIPGAYYQYIRAKENMSMTDNWHEENIYSV